MPHYSDMLIYLRKRSRLTQQELADKTGLTRSAIGMYETGKREPDLETLEIFADFYNVDMNTLTGRTLPSQNDDNKESPAPGGAELTPTQQKAWEFIQQMDDDALERFIAAAKALMG